MTALVVIGAALLLVLTWMLTKAAVISWRRAGHCDHPDCVRYWFKNHNYLIWCRRCATYQWRGRDPKHGPYPKVGDRAA